MKFSSVASRKSLQNATNKSFSLKLKHYSFPFPIFHTSLGFEEANPLSFSQSLSLLQQRLHFLCVWICPRLIYSLDFSLNNWIFTSTLGVSV